MRFLRILAPFLFVRNWFTGEWEFSRARAVLFGIFLLFFFLAILIIIKAQAPIEYSVAYL